MMKKSQFVTQQDNLNQIERQVFTLRQRVHRAEISSSEIITTLPVAANINGLSGTLHMNAAGEEELRMPVETIVEMGSAFWQNHFEPVQFEKSINRILNHWLMLREGRPLTYWNQVRRNGSKQYHWYSNTAIMLAGTESAEFLVLCFSAQQLGLTNRKLSRLLEEDELVEKYFRQYQLLSEREKQIIILLVMGHSNPQIGEILHIARSTVETHRKNINRKLDFSSYFQLLRFAQAFDLV